MINYSERDGGVGDLERQRGGDCGGLQGQIMQTATNTKILSPGRCHFSQVTSKCAASK